MHMRQDRPTVSPNTRVHQTRLSLSISASHANITHATYETSHLPRASPTEAMAMVVRLYRCQACV